MERGKFSLRSRIKSFRYAIKGVAELFRSEANAWIHLACTVVVIAGAWWFDFSAVEWIAVAFAIGMVLAAETFNTAIEAMCNYACKERDPSIGRIKDLSAAGVLISAIAAATIGAILFVPRIIALFEIGSQI